VLKYALAGSHRYCALRGWFWLWRVGYEVDVDPNRDGAADYAVFQQEAGGFGSSGQGLVYVQNLATQAAAVPYYYTDGDFDVSTQVPRCPLAALGLDRGTTFDFSVLAYDNYVRP